MKKSLLLMTVCVSFFLCIESNADEFFKLCNFIEQNSMNANEENSIIEEDVWWYEILESQKTINPLLNITVAEKIFEIATTKPSVLKNASLERKEKKDRKNSNDFFFVISNGKVSKELKKTIRKFNLNPIIGEDVNYEELIPKLNSFMTRKFGIDDNFINLLKLSNHETIIANYSAPPKSEWIHKMNQKEMDFNGKSVKCFSGKCPLAKTTTEEGTVYHLKMKEALISIIFLDELMGSIKDEMFTPPEDTEFKDQEIELPIMEFKSNIDLNEYFDNLIETRLFQSTRLTIDKYGVSNKGATTEYSFNKEVSIIQDDNCFKLDRECLILYRSEGFSYATILQILE